MESVKPSAGAEAKRRVSHAINRVRHLRGMNGICPIDGVGREVCQGNIKIARRLVRKSQKSGSRTKLAPESEEISFLESILAKIFATVSSVKAAYVHLQHAQYTHDDEAIRAADELIVTELSSFSELKQSFFKKQFDPHPRNSVALSKVQEQRSLLETYEVTGKKLESQIKLQDSEITFLKEKADELNTENNFLEKRLSEGNQMQKVEDHGLRPTLIFPAYRSMVKSIQNFVRVMIKEMISANWDISYAADTIEPGASYHRAEDRCFAIEKYTCRTMFDGFHILNSYRTTKFCKDRDSRKQIFLHDFSKLKSRKVKEYLRTKPKSGFAEFCRLSYLNLVHPKMESSFFRNLDQRNQVQSGRFPDTEFLSLFLEMAKQVWLLNSLALFFDPEAFIFQVGKDSRFSEVYMEAVNDEAFDLGTPDPCVAFTVMPGFRVENTVIQCRVYLSQLPSRS